MMFFHRTVGNRRRWLRASVKKFILPELKKMGFERRIFEYKNEFDREEMSFFPWGIFFRKNEFGDFQLEPEMLGHGGGTEFRISFGERVQFFDEHAYNPLGRSTVGSFALYASTRSQSTFRLGFWAERTAQQADYDRLMAKVAGMLPQIDDALLGGSNHPNVRFWPGQTS